MEKSSISEKYFIEHKSKKYLSNIVLWGVIGWIGLIVFLFSDYKMLLINRGYYDNSGAYISINDIFHVFASATISFMAGWLCLVNCIRYRAVVDDHKSKKRNLIFLGLAPMVVIILFVIISLIIVKL